MENFSKLLTARECASYIGVSESYFYKLRKKYPDLPYHKFGLSKRRYYNGEEVMTFLLNKTEEKSDVEIKSFKR